MTVKELIERLSAIDEYADVMIDDFGTVNEVIESEDGGYCVLGV